MTATARPWHVQIFPDHTSVIAANGVVVATTPIWNKHYRDENVQNSALICKAVNSHDALVAALRETLDCLINETVGQKDTPWVAGVKTRARSTLNAVEGKE